MGLHEWTCDSVNETSFAESEGPLAIMIDV
jgi:hypothetical protein